MPVVLKHTEEAEMEASKEEWFHQATSDSALQLFIRLILEPQSRHSAWELVDRDELCKVRELGSHGNHSRGTLKSGIVM